MYGGCLSHSTYDAGKLQRKREILSQVPKNHDGQKLRASSCQIGKQIHEDSLNKWEARITIWECTDSLSTRKQCCWSQNSWSKSRQKNYDHQSRTYRTRHDVVHSIPKTWNLKHANTFLEDPPESHSRPGIYRQVLFPMDWKVRIYCMWCKNRLENFQQTLFAIIEKLLQPCRVLYKKLLQGKGLRHGARFWNR